MTAVILKTARYPMKFGGTSVRTRIFTAAAVAALGLGTVLGTVLPASASVTAASTPENQIIGHTSPNLIIGHTGPDLIIGHTGPNQD
jgi:hypothetical protein